MKFRRPQLIPLLFIISATLLLTGLGIWQVDRLMWKEALMENIAAAQALPVEHGLPEEHAFHNFRSQEEYRRVSLIGMFYHDKALYLVAQPQKGEPGFSVLTPFKQEDGRIALVRRGWSPKGKESRPEGMQRIDGIVRRPRERHFFALKNRPESGLWFHEDVSAMSEHTGLLLEHMIVEAVGERKPEVYPMPSDGKIILKNDHLGYAITWFSLAVIGLFMFAVYHRIPSKNP